MHIRIFLYTYSCGGIGEFGVKLLGIAYCRGLRTSMLHNFLACLACVESEIEDPSLRVFGCRAVEAQKL